jgi:hypothetical protein
MTRLFPRPPELELRHALSMRFTDSDNARLITECKRLCITRQTLIIRALDVYFRELARSKGLK